MNEGDEPVDGDAEGTAGDSAPERRERGRRPAPGREKKQPQGRPSDDDVDDWDDDWDEDDWDDDGRPGGGLDLRLVGAIVAAVVLVVLVVLFTRDDGESSTNAETTVPSGETQPTGDQGGFCGDWPAGFGGDGTSVAGIDGVHIWSDFGGIHLRSNLDEPVTVKLTGNSDFAVSAPGTTAELSAQEGKEITATFPPGDGSDGPDFDISCFVTNLDVEVTGPDGPIEPTLINIGGSSVATENPYTLVRDPA